ncbi:hypothetical protein V2J09_014085 [Rumex salicifolius]
MASKLITQSPYEAPNDLDISLRESFNLHQPKLKPPLKLIIPSPSEYSTLNMAISYGLLCEPLSARPYIKHLHAIVNDGYAFFVQLLVQIVDQLYPKLLQDAKKQLIWITSVVVDVAGLGFGNLLQSLMRQIVGGDLSDANLWLSFELINLLLLKWDSILHEEPDALTSALYVYLRLLSDHYRLPNIAKYRELKQKEIEFCLKTLNEQFGLCIKLGRDLIRLLQDLFHIPEFLRFWKTLVLEPTSLKAHGFCDICDLYGLRTPSRYFLLRITPEMEIQLRFLLTSVKFGSQTRHQAWFAAKFLCVPERETVICDIVRFICCAHHPSNEDIQSDIIPRWAVIGWLLKRCTKKYVEANVKLALFFDWLFFDEKVDTVMNIEPVMLLMLNSIPRYADMTQSLLEFLILLVDNYDVDRKSLILGGVSTAFNVLVQKEVVRSIDALISCEALSPFKEKLKMLLMRTDSHVPSNSVSSSTPLSTVAVESQNLTGGRDAFWHKNSYVQGLLPLIEIQKDCNEPCVILSCGAFLHWEDGKIATFNCSFLVYSTMDITAVGTNRTLVLQRLLLKDLGTKWSHKPMSFLLGDVKLNGS